MSNNDYLWNFVKSDADYIYDTLKKFGDSLRLESDGIFEPLITIADLADDSRVYSFHIGVPELSGFTWRVFEVNKKSKTNKFELIFPSIIQGAKKYYGTTDIDLSRSITDIINEKEISNELSMYYNKVIVKRKLKKDFKNDTPKQN
jgi:hypothetical protein